jgi:hypothetical protein
MGPVNHPGSPKLWVIAHENGHKRKNDEFSVMPLKYVLSVMGLVNHPRTPKLWAIAQKNGHKQKTMSFFCHSYPKCAYCHIPCKSPLNLKTMVTSSQKWP